MSFSLSTKCSIEMQSKIIVKKIKKDRKDNKQLLGVLRANRSLD